MDTTRLLALALTLLLSLLQALAPLLHAHATDDPRAAMSEGVHVPGLEPVTLADDGVPSVVARTYPLIEEADLSRRDGGDRPDVLPLTVQGTLKSSDTHALKGPGSPSRCPAAACDSPPSRARPAAPAA